MKLDFELAPPTQIREKSIEEGKVVVKVWDKASKNFAIKAVNKGGQYKAVAQEGRLRMAFTVTALFADTSPERPAERVIRWHMEVDLKIYSNLSKKQYGFKLHYCCSAQIS